MTSQPSGPLTVKGLIELTEHALGVPARPTTVDGLVAGDGSAAVRGVAVTTLATIEVLEHAVAAGANVVVTHEPLYYDHLGQATPDLETERDPVFGAKRAFVDEHGLAVWRYHDAWHDRRPDGIDEGTADALGWSLDPGEAANGTAVCDVGSTTLADMAAHVARSLGGQASRFIGDPALPVRRVALDLGFRGFARNRGLLRRADVDAVVVGEAHEWETGSYAADAARVLGRGLVVVGHVPSEQAGMALFAEWLGALLRDAAPGVEVTLLPTPDAYSPA